MFNMFDDLLDSKNYEVDLTKYPEGTIQFGPLLLVPKDKEAAKMDPVELVNKALVSLGQAPISEAEKAHIKQLPLKEVQETPETFRKPDSHPEVVDAARTLKEKAEDMKGNGIPAFDGISIGEVIAKVGEPTLAEELGGMLAEVLKGVGLGKSAVIENKAHTVPFETNDNGVALEANGLKVIHFHDEQTTKGSGLTVCYEDHARLGIRNPRAITLSTAMVHPQDTFSKKKGTEVAVKNFLSGKTITLPVLEGSNVIDTLKCYFWHHDTRYVSQMREAMSSRLEN